MKTPFIRQQEIFAAALKLPNAEQRRAYLDQTCASDPQLRQHIEALFAAHNESGTFLQPPVALVLEHGLREAEAVTLMSVSEKAGDHIGRYKLLQQIGEGGMGVVYMAEQEEPVRRRVALKIIKLGMDTRQVVARFEAERQALALMDHPNIAKVLDGGATETGRPYFVMELVQGVPITDFCDKAKLPANERLKLFIQVCQAIQSAHQKGIIHRDIKPSNVLVTLHDGVPVPKVIDFGIAKATNQKLTEKTLFTNFATMIGTPAYMSPEQAEMSGLDIDTRTDIYALGVLLYALLTGTTPFPEKRLRSLGYGEMQRVILEEEPERPSTRLRKTRETGELGLGDSKSAIRNLQSEIDTDLDWIVMKCLEKDRQRRYETANGLASDIQRHLSNEPVFARPPSAGYRFQKAIRRNKAAFVAASAVAAALIVGLGISSWMFIKEKQAYRRAVAAEHKESILRESADKARAEEANARRMAEDARQREAEQRSLAEARAYAADINLAQQALAKNNFGRDRQVLDRHYPQPGQTNRPGWEWRYLWGQSRSDALFKVTQKIGTIISLAVSSDGRTLAVGLLEGGVSVLDISNLRAPRHIVELEKTGGLAIVDFSPREPLLAYSTSKGTKGGIDGDTVTLWNMEKKQAVATLPYERSSCSSLRFLANGESLAVCVSDSKNRYEGRVDLLSVPGLKKLASFTNYTNGASRMGLEIALAPAQKTLAIASESLQVIDLSTGAVRWSAKTDAASSFGRMALSPDGKTLFSTEGRISPVIRIWDFSTGKEIGPRLTDHRALVTSLIVTADGKTLVSGAADQTIRLWDVSDPAQAKALGRPLQGNRSIVSSLALLPDGKTVLSASGDGSIYAWDITAIRKDANPIILPKVGWWVFDREGKNIFNADRAGQISRWNGENFQTGEQLFNVGKDFYNACFSRDGRWFATGSTNGAFELWDLPQRKRLGRFGNYPGKVDPWDFSPDGTRLLVLDKANQLFCEWDVNTVQQTRAFPAVEQEQRSSFSKDWRWFLSASYMGNFYLEEAMTGRHFSKNLEIHNVISTAFSRDGKHFAAASFLGFAKVWETETFRPVATVGERSVPYYSVNFSPDGTRLITGSGPSEAITIWDLTTELELIRLEGKASQYGRGRFSPDGNVLAAWGTPGELHLWRAPSWAEIEAAEKTESRTQ